MPGFRERKIAFISSFLPRHCGIATFTDDLATAVSRHAYGQPLDGVGGVRIVAVSDRPGGYQYGPEVTLDFQQFDRESYRNVAEFLNTSGLDIVSLQHEYGLFGGEYGEYVLDLVDRLKVPLVTTCHTILGDLPDKKRRTLQHICEKSTTVVVMAEKAMEILHSVYGVPKERIRMIHHGVPELPFSDPESFKRRFDFAGRPVILTFGFLSPPKGIEFMLEALAKVVPSHPDVIYVILGETHPSLKREMGESYRFMLENLAVDLGIQENVVFHKRFVSNPDLFKYLQATDVYVTPYPSKEQITSGTLAYAMACGKAIVSTSYWHAQELLREGRGLLVEGGDVDGLAEAVGGLLDDPSHRDGYRKAAYEFSRQMLWPSVGRRYAEVIEETCSRFVEHESAVVPKRRVLLRMSLPEVRLDHFLGMTDDTGIVKDGVFATPNRRHGYRTDNNARALVVSSMVWSLFQDERALPCMQTYLAFLHHAQTTEGGRFRNSLSYDRRWLDSDGGDDCQGHVAWALGHLVAHAPNTQLQCLAVDLLRSSLPMFERIGHPRPWAYTILGLHYYLRVYPDEAAPRRLLGDLADRLEGAFAAHASDDWPWYEDTVTYGNGRLPQALLVAGFMLDKKSLIERGLHILRWLLDAQATDTGYLSVVGNDGWFRRGVQRPVFDQQPMEPATLIGACKAAHRVSGDDTWLREMRRCFEWYLGRNDLGTAMVDFKTWGCYDSLKRSGLDPNQGAEAVTCWLLSLLIMHEMQTGDPPSVG